MKYAHLTLSIAALGGAVAMAATAPAHAAISLNGPVLNGIAFNGVALNGVNLNGRALNGIELNGMRMNGTALHGAKTDIDSCQPKANQTCEPRVRAVILPTGLRMGLK